MTCRRLLKALPPGTEFRLLEEDNGDTMIVCAFTGPVENFIHPQWTPFLDPATHQIDVLPSGTVVDVRGPQEAED